MKDEIIDVEFEAVGPPTPKPAAASAPIVIVAPSRPAAIDAALTSHGYSPESVLASSVGFGAYRATVERRMSLEELLAIIERLAQLCPRMRL